MTVPLLLSSQYVGTTLYIFFDRAVTATPASELNGFTFELNSVPLVPVFLAITQNALSVTLPGAPISTDILTVEYDGLGTVTEAVAPFDPAAAFAAYTAFEIPEVPVPYSAETSANNAIDILFNEPIASTDGDLVTGWLVSVNAIPISMVGVTAALSDDQRSLTLTFPSNFEYTDDITIDYTPGTIYSWVSGYLPVFSLVVANLSTDGLPNSQYPLSYVTKYEVTLSNGIGYPKLGVSLNPVDVTLVAEYGPVRVFTGGTFGITLTNPLGITIAGKFVNIVDGLLITEKFDDSSVSAADRVVASQEWQDVIISRISQGLGKVRADDQSITVINTVIVQV
jgi:hypothetical protein